MPTVIAHHDVKDKDHWLASPKREEFFWPSASRTSGRSSTRKTRPELQLMDVADMDAVMGAMETGAAAEAMAHDGVVPESLVILVEAWFLPERSRQAQLAPDSGTFRHVGPGRQTTPGASACDTPRGEMSSWRNRSRDGLRL